MHGAHPKSYISTINSAVICFHSDGSVEGPGFELNYACVIPQKCGGNLTGSIGNLVSPDWPYKYPNNVDCFWNITCEHNKVVELSFSEFDMEYQDDCR